METLAELQVKIVADAKDLEKALRQSDKDIKDLGKTAEKETKSISKSFEVMGKALIGVGGAITVTMGMMIKSFAGTGSELHDLNLKTSVSVKALAGLKYAAEQNGASLGTIEMALRRSSVMMEELKDGTSSASDAFRKMGLSLSDLEGLSPEEQFMKILSSLAAVESQSTRSQLAIALFSRSGTDMLPMLSEGADGLKKMMDEGVALSGWSVDAADKADDLGDAFNTLKTAIGGVSNTVGESLAPALKGVADLITSLTKGVNNWAKANPEATSTLTQFGGVLGVIATVAGGLALILPKIVASLTAIAGIAIAPILAALFGIGMMAYGGILGTQSKSATDAVKETNKALSDLQGKFDGTKTSLEGYNKGLLNSIEAHKRFVEVGIQANGLSKEEINDEYAWIEAAQKAYDANEEYIKSLQGNVNAKIEVADKTDILAESYDNLKDKASDAGSEIQMLTDAYVENLKILDDYQKKIEQQKKTQQFAAVQGLGGYLGNIMQGMGYDNFMAAMKSTDPVYAQLQGQYSEFLQMQKDLPASYATGGIVPGSLGQPQLAVVHGGEQITPADKIGGDTYIIQGSVLVERQIGEIALKYARNSGRKDYTNSIP